MFRSHGFIFVLHFRDFYPHNILPYSLWDISISDREIIFSKEFDLIFRLIYKSHCQTALRKAEFFYNFIPTATIPGTLF
jgi:hypothetical protein